MRVTPPTGRLRGCLKPLHSRRTRPLRVLITGPDLNQAEGTGVQRHVANVVSAFRADTSVEVSPFAATSVSYVEPWLLKGVRLAWKYLVFPAHAIGSDVVHLNSTIDDRSVARDSGFALLGAALRRPVVLQFHGGDATRLRCARWGPMMLVTGTALRSCRKVLFLSEAQADSLSRLYSLSRVACVNNCVDVEVYAGGGPSSDDRFSVLYLGRLDSDKGLLEAIQGYVAVRKAGWQMRIAGNGPLLSKVLRLTRTHADIEYLGFVGQKNLVDLLAWADVLVLPSSHEGLPYAVLEAAASSTALVTSGVGALPHVVQDGVTGYIIPPRDALALAQALTRLDSDRFQLEQMKRSARALVEREYSHDHLRRDFLLIWNEALGQAQ